MKTYTKQLITFPTSSSNGYALSMPEGYVVLMPVSETDYQCSNKNTYISKIWALLKSDSKKLGYILKLVMLVS